MRRSVTTLRSKATLSFLALGMTMILPSLANAAPGGIKWFHDPSELPAEKVMTPDGASGCKLSYGGGALISNIQAVPVFWSSKVDAAVQAWAPGYLAALVNSPYQDALSEYSSSSQKIGRGTATKGYVITPASTATTGISSTTISNELAKQVTAGNLPKPVYDSGGNANTMFIVFFPKGYSLTLQGSKSCASGGFCAYHDVTTVSNNDVPFAAIPDMSAGSGCDKGCQVCPTGDTVCSGSATNVAGTSVSHEIAEAVTDVSNNSAWVDQKSACGEIGDICAATSAIDVDTGIVPGSSPPIYAQLEWSNSQNKCEMSNPTIGVQPGGGTTNPGCTAGSCSGATPICDATSGQCRGCTADTDCSGATPHCATSASDSKHGTCVACTANSQCGKTAPVCEKTDTCGGCKTNSDCSAFSGTTCDTTSGSCTTSSTGGNDAGSGGNDAGSTGGDDAGSGTGDDDSGTTGGGGTDAGIGNGGGTGHDAGKGGTGKDGGAGSGASPDAGDDGGYDNGTPGGCSVGRGASSSTNALGFAGVLFGLAAFVRARRRSARRG